MSTDAVAVGWTAGSNPPTLMISAVLTRFWPSLASITTLLTTSVACAPASSTGMVHRPVASS